LQTRRDDEVSRGERQCRDEKGKEKDEQDSLRRPQAPKYKTFRIQGSYHILFIVVATDMWLLECNAKDHEVGSQGFTLITHSLYKIKRTHILCEFFSESRVLFYLS
jgi:hypothetical protein